MCSASWLRSSRARLWPSPPTALRRTQSSWSSTCTATPPGSRGAPFRSRCARGQSRLSHALTRDLLARAEPARCGLWHCERSHVDVPRLVAGNVALQVFTAFTHVPSAPVCPGPWPVCDPLPVGNSNVSFDAVSMLVPFSGAKRRPAQAC